MSEIEKRKIVPRILVCIVPAKRDKKMRTVFREEKVPIFYECGGHGTAPSEVLDILGIGESDRLITMTFVPQFQARPLIDKINGSMSLREKGNGIGFTMPITGMQGAVVHTMERVIENMDPQRKAALEQSIRSRAEEAESGMKENAAYAAIWVFAAKGYSDEVMQAAREAGARGGTVLRGSRRGDAEVTEKLGIPQQAEQEIILLLVDREQKTDIMKAIASSCGLASPARAIVISMPVDEVMGITA